MHLASLATLSMLLALGARAEAASASPALDALTSPILFHGDARTAYRDPAALYHDGVFHIFFTLVTTGDDGGPFLHLATSRSRDLASWSKPRLLTQADRNLNYSSPGNVVRFGRDWILCIQTYPRPRGEKYGNATSRLWVMRSADLETWGAPELLRVKGPDVPVEAMGRMIDPFLLQDIADPAKWWCFYKQNGVSWSWSQDLIRWTYSGSASAGENVCVVHDGAEYVMSHSPKNGIGIRRGVDLREWRDCGLLTLGQPQWPWAAGRITAGFILDARAMPGVRKWLILFHGSAFPEEDPRGGFDNHASIGIAWSDDLIHWSWPGR